MRRAGLAFLFVVKCSAAIAAPFSVSYVGTMNNSTTAGEFFTNVAQNETFKVTLVMDNGGTSSQSQTWVASDLVSVKWEFNDARNVVFEQDINTSYRLYIVIGDAKTDASGSLTAIFSAVISGGTVFNAVGLPDLVSPAEWYLDGSNGIFFGDSGPTGSFLPVVSDAAGGVQMNIASWSNPIAVASASPSVPVPVLPPLLLLALSGIVGILGALRFKNRL